MKRNPLDKFKKRAKVVKDTFDREKSKKAFERLKSSHQEKLKKAT